MRKNLTKIIAAIMVASVMLGCTTAFAAAPQISGADLGLTEAQVNQLNKQDIYINNEKLVYDEATYGIAYITPAPTRTMIPMRAFAESFGLTVYWDSAAGCAKCEGPLGVIEMYNGEYGLTVNGEKRTFDQPTVDIRNGRTYVALRAFCNAIGITDENVTWRPGRIDITCDMDTIKAEPSSNNGISGVIKAEDWHPEELAKTLAKAEELIEKYGEPSPVFGDKGVNMVYNNKLCFLVRTNNDGSLSMNSWADKDGLHFTGYSLEGTWVNEASREYMNVLFSETVSDTVRENVVAILKDIRANLEKYTAEIRATVEYSTEYYAAMDKYNNLFETVSWALYDVGDGCVFALNETGGHVYNESWWGQYSNQVTTYNMWVK